MSKVKRVITDRARFDLDDSSAADWTDDTLLDYFNDGVRSIMSERPDARIDVNGHEIAFELASDVDNDDIIIDDRFIPALVYYVCYRALGEEGGDKFDSDRSGDYYDKFVKELAFI